MKRERTNIEFPLWRKKVDKSLFDYNGTTIPAWACNMWGIQSEFSHVTSKKDTDAKVLLEFESVQYEGWVTAATKGRATPTYRLWYDESLTLELKHTFLMSYMRSLETSLSSLKTVEIEKSIPFWEFLDIEYDRSQHLFRLSANYKQEPSFPELFKRLVLSPPIQKIDDSLEGKNKGRIYKQDWRPRSDLESQLGAYNVIYTLIDTNNKLLYVGEAVDLVKRLSQHYPSIPNWNFFRYDVLPDELAAYRVTLERMVIRDFAALFSNSKHDSSVSISEYKLANSKIDS